MRKLAWPPDVAVGVVSAVLGIGYLIGAMQITPDPSSFNVMGPRVAPMAIGIATVLCSVALVAQGLRSRPGSTSPAGSSAAPTSEDEGTTDAEPVDQAGSRRRTFVTFGLFTAYILVFIPLGYLLSTFAFLAALTTYADPHKWPRNGVFAAAFAGVVFVLFTRGLRVELPPGLLG